METDRRKNCVAVTKEWGFLTRAEADNKYSDLPKKSVDFVPLLW